MSDSLILLRRPLLCPYCGGKLTVDLRTESTGAYLSHEVADAIACDELRCAASWEPDGTPRDLPDFVRFPSLYDPPTAAAAASRTETP